MDQLNTCSQGFGMGWDTIQTKVSNVPPSQSLIMCVWMLSLDNRIAEVSLVQIPFKQLPKKVLESDWKLH